MPQVVEVPGHGQVEFPDGMSDEQIVAAIRANSAPEAPAQIESQGFFGNLVAGAGKAVTDLGLGAKQVVTELGNAIIPTELRASGDADKQRAVLRQEAATKREADAPLMQMPGSSTGAVLGGVATALPALAVPGANTMAGASALGAIQGAVQPTEAAGQRATNLAAGGLFGLGGQKVGGYVASKIGEKIAARTAAGEAAQQAGSAVDAAAAAAQKAGYVIPPSTTNPTVANKSLEALAGLRATEQAASAKNQAVTNALVRQEFGLPENIPLSKGVLESIRKQAGRVYQQIGAVGQIKADAQFVDELKGVLKESGQIASSFPGANLGADKQVRQMVRALSKDKFEAKSALAFIKALRNESSGNLKAATVGGDPTKRALGSAQRKAADALEGAVLRHLEATGKQELAASFDAARKTIAKTYTVESALKGNNVSAKLLAKQLDKGRPLSGYLKTIAEFGTHFEKAAQVPKGSPVRLTDAIPAAVGVGGTLAGSPAVAAALAVPVARSAARNTILSQPYQSRFIAPNYAPNNSLLKLLEQQAQQSYLYAPGIGLAANSEKK